MCRAVQDASVYCTAKCLEYETQLLLCTSSAEQCVPNGMPNGCGAAEMTRLRFVAQTTIPLGVKTCTEHA